MVERRGYYEGMKANPGLSPQQLLEYGTVCRG